MKPMLALGRETWWLWILFLSVGAGLAHAVDGVFVITIPICVFTFVYFAFIRYDEHGNPREPGE